MHLVTQPLHKAIFSHQGLLQMCSQTLLSIQFLQQQCHSSLFSHFSPAPTHIPLAYLKMRTASDRNSLPLSIPSFLPCHCQGIIPFLAKASSHSCFTWFSILRPHSLCLNKKHLITNQRDATNLTNTLRCLCVKYL